MVVLTAELPWTAFTVLFSLLAPSHRHESKTNPPSGSSSLLICLPVLHPWRCSLQRHLSHHVDNPKWRLILRLISFYSRFHAPFILLDGGIFIFFSSPHPLVYKRGSDKALSAPSLTRRLLLGHLGKAEARFNQGERMAPLHL